MEDLMFEREKNAYFSNNDCDKIFKWCFFLICKAMGETSLQMYKLNEYLSEALLLVEFVNYFRSAVRFL